VCCEIDGNLYPRGVKVTEQQMQAINIARDEVHGEWIHHLAKPTTILTRLFLGGLLLENLREMLAPVLGTAIEVAIEVPANAPPLFADRTQLETVLVNLAVNARDAMPDGGRLAMTVTTERVTGKRRLAGLRPGGYLRIDLTDTGAGMDGTTLAHAAEPFFTTKPAGQGTGLGLAMARGFAQQSGGAFAIKSVVGVGTTVALWFPEAESVVGESTSTRPPDAHLASQARVLVADDDPMVREILVCQLVAQGFRVSQASDGLAALAQLEAGDIPDLLVTDFAMPGMNGLTLIKEARRLRPGLPALLLTGYADGNLEDDVSALRADSTVVLRKPVSDAELSERASILLNAADC
jgi:CheY-like chemotaxis protein